MRYAIALLACALATPAEAGSKPPPANAWVPDCREAELSELCTDPTPVPEVCCVPDGETVETACHGALNRVAGDAMAACPGRVALRCVEAEPGPVEPEAFTEIALRLESCYAPPGGDVADVAQCADPARRSWEPETGCHRRRGPFARRWVGVRCASDPSADTAEGFATVDRAPESNPCQ